jgi:putative two-component system response regulator
MEIVLVVDDERQVRDVIVRLLERNGYTCLDAASGAEARRVLAENDVALLLCDVNMPGESGLSLVRHVLGERPGTAAIMVTGVEDPELAKTALEYGAYGYITKVPFKSTELLVGIENALRRRRLELENDAHRERLEREVVEGLAALSTAREDTVHRLATAVEFRDAGTGRHIERMSEICALLAGRLGLDEARSALIREASQLHDVGKIAVPDHILIKPGALTPKERSEMERHAEAGYRLLSGSDSELLQLAAAIARTHHERYDGTGYPSGLSGTVIPLAGRIAAVADVFDALTQNRPYRKAVSVDEALTIMEEGRGTQFDPEVLDALIAAVDEIPPVQDAAKEGTAA